MTRGTLRIGCDIHIEASRIILALKDIDVMHERSAFAKATVDTPKPNRLRLSVHFVACHPKPKA